MSIDIWRKYLGPQQQICVVAVTCGRSKTCKSLDGVVVATDSDRNDGLGGAEAPDLVAATGLLRERGWDIEPGWIRCPAHRRGAGR